MRTDHLRALDARRNNSKPSKTSGNSKLSEEKKNLLVQDLIAGKKTIRQIASDHAVSKSTVMSISEAMLFEPAPDDPEDNEELDLRTRSLKRPQRCPAHGLVKFWPCVQCAAEQARAAAARRSPPSASCSPEAAI